MKLVYRDRRDGEKSSEFFEFFTFVQFFIRNFRSIDRLRQSFLLGKSNDRLSSIGHASKAIFPLASLDRTNFGLGFSENDKQKMPPPPQPMTGSPKVNLKIKRLGLHCALVDKQKRRWTVKK
jgi:hypothetical protein